MNVCLALTRGRVRAGPSLQLGTLSTRTALYTRRWRSSPGVCNLACVSTPAILSALSPLSWRAWARRAGRATHGSRHTFSGLAAVCRTPKTKLIGRPVPEIWPNLVRTDRLTDTRQTRLTNQPTNRTTGQQPFCQYPAVSWELL